MAFTYLRKTTKVIQFSMYRDLFRSLDKTEKKKVATSTAIMSDCHEKRNMIWA